MFDGISSRRTDPLAPIGGIARGIRRDAIQSTAGGWTNTKTGRGGDMDRHAHTEFIQPIRLVHPVIDSLLEFNALAARIVNREPDDAIREGVEIDLGPDTDPQIPEAVEREVERTQALEALADSRRWARAYGGSLLIALIDDGRKFEEPVDWSGIRRIAGFDTVDRHEADPFIQGSGGAYVAGRITHYRLKNLSHGLIHASRVFPMMGTKLPRRVRERRQFWGGSVLDATWAALRNYNDAVEGAAEALTLLTQGVFTSKHLSAAIDAGDIDKVQARIEALRVGMGLLGDIVLDAKDETYDIKNRPVSGVGEVLAQLQEYLVAMTDMPTSVLFGKTPGGLNAGENAGEIRSWYDHIGAVQKTDYTPAMRWVFKLILAAAEGPTRGERMPFKVVWPSLWQETDLIKAQTRVAQGQARSLDQAAAIVTPEEARMDPALVDNYKDFDPEAEPPPPPEPVARAFSESEDEEGEAAGLPAAVESPLSEIPAGESLISGKEAATLMGFKSGSTFKTMHRRGLIGGWRAYPGAPWRYSWGQIEKAVQQVQ